MPRFHIVASVLASLSIAGIVGCSAPRPVGSSLLPAGTSRVARAGDSCRVPIFVPVRIAESGDEFRVLSGAYTVRAEGGSTVFVIVSPRDPNVFLVHRQNHRTGIGTVIVTDKQTGAESRFDIVGLAAAPRPNRSAPAPARASCPDVPAVVPSVLTPTASLFRLEGGPYTAASSAPRTTASLFDGGRSLGVACSNPQPPNPCQATITVTNVSTNASLTFAVSY